MGALMRAFDWSSTSLGPPERWPVTLQTVTRMLLANSFPMLLWWGPDFIQLYNDAYIPVLGNKHPHAALGKPFRECWAEVFDVLAPLAEIPFRGGPATWMEDIPLELKRHGYLEEAHFTISYSAIPDPMTSSGIGGVLAIVHEISDKIVAERRILALRDLGAGSPEPMQAEDACDAAAKILGSCEKDVPFSLIYLLDESGTSARLAGGAGVENCTELCPESIDLRQPSVSWPLALSVQTENIVVVDDLARRFGRIPPGPWADPPAAAAIVPIKSTKAHELAGFLIAGISSRLKFDDSYRGFLELVSAQIASAIANARAYEAERKRNEALAEIDRTKTAFFSNISHELRTPLTLILGPLEDLLSQRDDLAPDDREQIELAHRNSLRLLKLVNTLLDFSRIEAGRVAAAYEPVDLSQFTADLASVFRSIVERAGLKLTIDCPPLPQPVYVDREMWEKIVFNLLSNAFKFTFEGEIVITLRAVDGGAEMIVSDTGTGIPVEELPELFKRFHRIRGARGRSYEGSGIGLALVQELIRLHGGSVRIESELGRGSRFIVFVPHGVGHLPAEHIGAAPARSFTSITADTYVHEAERWLANDLASAEVGRPSDEIGKASALKGEKALILVADDNADMRDYVTRMLASAYRIETVSDGAQAIDSIKKLHPDLVLTDVMMPVLDGFAVLEAVRSHPDLSSTPVILLSARAGEESRIEGLRAGADDYMVKPFSARELMARVEGQLELARLRKQAEEALLRSERLASLGRMAATISHEINNPLAALTNLLFLAQRTEGIPGEARELLEEADAELQRVAHITRQALGFYRESIAPSSTNISALVESTIDLLKGKIRTKKASIEKQWNILEEVTGVAGELRQVFSNLLANSIDATDDGGTIKVRISKCRLRNGGAGLRISFADNGKGMDPATMAHIFEPLYTTKGEVGTGLGLWVSRQIVEKHGGFIHVRSSCRGPWKGSTFSVVLPK